MKISNPSIKIPYHSSFMRINTSQIYCSEKLRCISYKIIILCLFVSVTIRGRENLKEQNKLYKLTVYEAQATNRNFLEVLMLNIGDPGPYSLLAIALSSKLFEPSRKVEIEGEGQFVRHFERWNMFEFNALCLIRYYILPENKYFYLTAAFGFGFSFVNHIPLAELEKNERNSRYLFYLVPEITFSIPWHPDYMVALRLHHRSGGFGRINGVHGGSNYIGLGLKYVF